ncbi:hypothetical protein JW964_15665, partial [candidate division KSB1 bacterium]|nr:hypothetical protein [candidate division KSB1 bacterium]
PNSKKRNLGERKPDSLPHFRFLKTGRYRGGQFFAKNDVTEEKTFHFRILGNKLIVENCIPSKKGQDLRGFSR